MKIVDFTALNALPPALVGTRKPLKTKEYCTNCTKCTPSHVTRHTHIHTPASPLYNNLALYVNIYALCAVSAVFYYKPLIIKKILRCTSYGFAFKQVGCVQYLQRVVPL